MKRFLTSSLSIILSFLIVFSSLAFAVSAGSDELSIIVASDCHFRPKGSIHNLGSDDAVAARYPLFSHARRNALMHCESEAILKSFLASAAESDAQYLLIAGDMVDDTTESDHEEFAKYLRAFEKSTGKQVFIVPGNHDLYSEFPIEKVRSIYNDFGYSQAVSIDDESMSYSADLGDGYRLLAVNCNNADVSITASMLSWMDAQIKSAKSDGREVIMMMHYNLLHHMSGLIADEVLDRVLNNRVSNADTVWQIIADMGVKYLFTGHAHANDITSSISAAGNQIFDIETGSLISYSSPYRVVDFSSSGVEIATKHIESINVADLPAGYTPEQLRLISSDFKAYSRGIVTASAYYECKLIAIDNPMAVPDRMGLSADDKLTKLMTKVFSKVYEDFCLPLYKTDTTNGNSLEEVVEGFGGSIPESSYTDIFDVAAQVLAAHIAGDEKIASDSVEVKILWSCAKAVLVDSLDGFEEDYENAVKKLPFAVKYSSVKSFASKLAFRQSVATDLLSVMIAPLIEGMTIDDFNPGDNNVTLPSFSEKPEIKTRWDEFTNLLKSVWEFLGRIFAVFKQSAFTKLQIA